MSVSVNSDGFIQDGRLTAWADIRAIATYKVDLFAYDDIYLAFRVGDESSWVEVREDEPGFDVLVAEVERRYPEVPQGWFHEVMLPAFAENYRVLWGVA